MAGAKSNLNVEVDVRDDGWHAAVKDAPAICVDAARAAHGAVEDAPAPALVSVMLCGDDDIADLNANYRGKAGPTNVLSFPLGDIYPDGDVMLGDIAVAFETVRREAARDGISIADHLAHMIVHGTLHLLGFDHQTDDEAEEMEGLEVEVLAILGIADPYARAEGAAAS